MNFLQTTPQRCQRGPSDLIRAPLGGINCISHEQEGLLQGCFDSDISDRTTLTWMLNASGRGESSSLLWRYVSVSDLVLYINSARGESQSHTGTVFVCVCVSFCVGEPVFGE